MTNSTARSDSDLQGGGEHFEPIAWMYERGEPFPVRYIHDRRTPAYLDPPVDHGFGVTKSEWTETPLFSRPSSPVGYEELLAAADRAVGFLSGLEGDWMVELECATILREAIAKAHGA